MLQKLSLAFFILTAITASSQTNFKQNETFSFNLVAGYQSFPNTQDLNTSLTHNNFTTANTPHFTTGLEFAGFSKKDILKAQFRVTGLFVKQSVQPTTMQSTTIGLLYGRDFLQNIDQPYFYPFIGFRMFDHTLLGHSTDGKQLNAWKVNFDFLVGLGLKQFLNSDLRGVFNNVDLNFGTSLPAINGEWKKEGSEYIAGTYKLKSTYFVTLTIGRGFRPAPIQR